MSAEFIAEEGVLKGLILSLEKGEEWTIGRDPAQVTLAVEDPKVSRIHLVCRKIKQEYVIENLSKENPTLVNGEAFTGEKVIKQGDKITLGESIFTFYPEGSQTSEPEEEYLFKTEENEEFTLPPEDQEEQKPSVPSEEEEGTTTNAPLVPPEEEEEQEPSIPHEEEEGTEASEPLVPSEHKEERKEQEPEPLVPPKHEEEEEELNREEIFQEVEALEPTLDLTPSARFIIKVIAGPNTGAEFALDLDNQYLIGTDPSTCDLIFNDLSVSREHARLSIDKEGHVSIEDLESRNGVIVDKERITAPKTLVSNSVVTLGTSAFILIDREAPSETIVTPVFEAPPEEEEEEKKKKEVVEEAPASLRKAHPVISTGSIVLALFVAGFAILLGIGMISLIPTTEVVATPENYVSEIQEVVKDYPGVRYTFNSGTKKLFLMGHVETAVRLNELLYRLKGLAFIRGIENNIVNDEAIWQEMNILLSKIPEFKGVSMHSPQPGVFVISGYLKTDKQAADLIDYLNVNFNYLNLLQNRVVVEEQVVDEVAAHLIQHGFGAVTVSFISGELVLTGYVNSTQTFEYESLVNSFEHIPGVRVIKNYVVAVSPELGVIDLNKRYPGKYRVTGFSKHGNVNINVVINGKLLARGDQIEGMTITSIQPHTIFLEKEGLKYKIEYNK